jgi:peptidoglycan/LPS O-acetylase OafA/YrhL
LEFLLGVVICRVYLRTKSVPFFLPAACVFAGLAAYCCLVLYGYDNISQGEYIFNGQLSIHRFVLWGIPSGLLVAGCIFLEKRGTGTRVWDYKWMKYIGDASYSIYLVHPIVFFLINYHVSQGLLLSPDISIFLQLLAGIGVGLLFYRWVETPLLKMLHRGLPSDKIKMDAS